MLVWKLSLPSQAAVHPHRIFLDCRDRLTVSFAEMGGFDFLAIVHPASNLNRVGIPQSALFCFNLWAGRRPAGMASAYWQYLRDRVIDAVVRGGMSRREAAARLG